MSIYLDRLRLTPSLRMLATFGNLVSNSWSVCMAQRKRLLLFLLLFLYVFTYTLKFHKTKWKGPRDLTQRTTKLNTPTYWTTSRIVNPSKVHIEIKIRWSTFVFVHIPIGHISPYLHPPRFRLGGLNETLRDENKGLAGDGCSTVPLGKLWN